MKQCEKGSKETKRRRLQRETQKGGFGKGAGGSVSILVKKLSTNISKERGGAERGGNTSAGGKKHP